MASWAARAAAASTTGAPEALARSPSALPAAPASRLRLPRRHAGVLSQPERVALCEQVEALLACPTAPYLEDLQAEAVRAFVDARPGL